MGIRAVINLGMCPHQGSRLSLVPFLSCSNVESNARYRNLVATVNKSSALNAVYQAVKVERESLAGTNLGQIS